MFTQLTFDLKPKKEGVEFIAPKYGIKIRCIDKTVYWYDSIGEYSADFDTLVEAREGFKYWCRSALKGGEII